MNDTIILNANELFQLAAIGPCAVVICYLFFATQGYRYTIIPICYFSFLLGTLLLPILAIFPELDGIYVRNSLVFIEHLLPTFAFLLVVQFLLRRPPPWKYWLILSVPLIGGSSLFYLTLTNQHACFGDACIAPDIIMDLYRAFTTAVIFLLVVPMLSKHVKTSKRGKEWRHQYWLIVMLTMYNLFIMVVDLLHIATLIPANNAKFIHTMFSVSFIYLALSSVFRVFNKSLHIQSLQDVFSSRDQTLIDQIDRFIEEEEPYCNLQFNRASLADEMGLTEQHLSRLINNHYKKSFSELMNEKRITMACDKLENSTTSITEISFDVGFRSITSFNRVFKEAHGISPSKYREREKRLNGE